MIGTMTDSRGAFLRTPPGPIARAFFRMPSGLYRVGLGWLLGRRFVEITHTGRKTGLLRRTVVEVVDRDDDSVVVAAAWGPKSDWYRNIVAHPEIRISTGRLRDVPAVASVLPPEEAAASFASYRARHPAAAKSLAKTLGLALDDPRAMADTVPAVRLTHSR